MPEKNYYIVTKRVQASSVKDATTKEKNGEIVGVYREDQEEGESKKSAGFTA